MFETNKKDIIIKIQIKVFDQYKQTRSLSIEKNKFEGNLSQNGSRMISQV